MSRVDLEALERLRDAAILLEADDTADAADWNAASCREEIAAMVPAIIAELKAGRALVNDLEGAIVCMRCGNRNDGPKPLDESRIREIVREEIAKAAQPCRHEKWIEMGEAFEVCRSCGTKR